MIVLPANTSIKIVALSCRVRGLKSGMKQDSYYPGEVALSCRVRGLKLEFNLRYYGFARVALSCRVRGLKLPR